jgi:hypothetical protein
VKERCCRSIPRCAACPARAATTVRAQQAADTPAALLAEILRSRPGRPLPRSVATALADLELARTAR